MCSESFLINHAVISSMLRYCAIGSRECKSDSSLQPCSNPCSRLGMGNSLKSEFGDPPPSNNSSRIGKRTSDIDAVSLSKYLCSIVNCIFRLEHLNLIIITCKFSVDLREAQKCALARFRLFAYYFTSFV